MHVPFRRHAGRCSECVLPGFQPTHPLAPLAFAPRQGHGRQGHGKQGKVGKGTVGKGAAPMAAAYLFLCLPVDPPERCPLRPTRSIFAPVRQLGAGRQLLRGVLV